MKRRRRLARAQALAEAQASLDAGCSEREAAAGAGVARSTLRDWRSECSVGPAPAALAAFAETPEGVQWLHTQEIAAHFVITLLAGGGVRLVCRFLELSGLAQFVGASYGAQQKLNGALEEAVVAYAREERARLGASMPRREVTLCEDETFHPQICLVGLEPVSNFIVLERYAEDRSAATWTKVLRESLGDLPVAVVQGTSDEGAGLLRHVRKDLGAHHSPDLFHVQHEVVQATALNLARQVEQTAEAATQAQERLAAQRQAQRAYATEAHGPGRPPAFAERIRTAVTDLVAAEDAQRQAERRQAEAKELVRELGHIYHPYDPANGEAQPPERLAERFAGVWARLADIATAADLPERSRRQIAKAQRVTTQLLATVAFFFTLVHAKVEALALPPALETAVYERLIPALYLERVAARSTRAEPRAALRALSAQLLDPLRRPEHPLQALDATARATIERVAGECADLFQRSSSAVEGRNGQLSLHHHGRHRLSDRKLAALTAVHNYYIQHPDGTSAARRFFAAAPAPMFRELLQRMPLPPRPARKRPCPPRPPYLTPLAA
jgi:PAS domain-containing protein